MRALVPCESGLLVRHVQRHVPRTLGSSGGLRAPSAAHKRLQTCTRASEEGREPDPPPPAPDQKEATGGEAEAAPAAPQSPSLQLPRDVIERMRNSVFGLDTLFVKGVENYQGDGVLFRGNLRGDPAAAHAKMKARLQEELGDAYRLYLLEDRDGSPLAVVLPAAAADAGLTGPGALVEGALAAGLAAATALTSLNIFGAGLFDAALLTLGPLDGGALAAAAPGTAALLAILAAHEAGHIVAASRRGVSLAPPLLLPAGLGLLGSLGAVTAIRSRLPNRTALAEVAAAGPLAGAAVSAVLLLLGLALTAGGQGGMEVDVASFKESLAVGALGRAVLGEALFSADSVDASPLLVAGWAGLIVNALNLIPAGELDGGRLFLALCGRPAAKAMGVVTLPLLAVTGFSSSLALFWLLLILTLQRGPPPPCEEELGGLPPQLRTAAVVGLLLPLLVLAPFPGA